MWDWLLQYWNKFFFDFVLVSEILRTILELKHCHRRVFLIWSSLFVIMPCSVTFGGKSKVLPRTKCSMAQAMNAGKIGSLFQRRYAMPSAYNMRFRLCASDSSVYLVPTATCWLCNFSKHRWKNDVWEVKWYGSVQIRWIQLPFTSSLWTNWKNSCICRFTKI